jgi:hypothetical protein
MKPIHALIILAIISSCAEKKEAGHKDLKGSWQLFYASSSTKDTTMVTDLSHIKMIKILNDTHFAFMQHILKDDADTLAVRSNEFGGGGGTYTLIGNAYKEHLEFCSAAGYEGKDFDFTIEVRGDTLIQTGEEKLKDLGIGEENLKLVEKYVRIN